MRRLVLPIVPLALLVVLSCSPKAPAAKAPVSKAVIADQLKSAGLEAPKQEVMSEDFSLESLNGGKVSLSSFKGKVVLLSFWATWCGPCKQEMPAMQTLYKKLKDKGFEVVAVDMMEDKATVAQFVKSAGYTFPVLLDSTGEVGGGVYEARAIPTNYVVDKGGLLVGRKIGIDGPEWTSQERITLFESLLSQ
ncbi:MAG: TlpA disulfide reductase family protein [Spirochaetia bacterium]